ncbi:MAG TPA: hypothetical protein VHQ66_11505, partial [Myxococcota bacterium]|nr:hypothetical protein [Myxococcota bacterium]
MGRCRARVDAAACEDALREEGGALDELLARSEVPIRRRCDEASADALGYLGVDDAVLQIPQACGDFAEDQLELAYADDLAALGPDARACQSEVAARVRALAGAVVKSFGAKCYARAYAGGRCDRAKRYSAVARARSKAASRILARCGAAFDSLGLASGPSLEARIDAALERVVVHSRHYAQQVYPPNDLGPTAAFGPHPVGVRTLELEDPARSHLTLA